MVTQQNSLAVSGGDEGKRMVEELLMSQGQKLKSALLTSLASRIAEDPFAKVKQLIQELIERLLQEANSEANQKGWCDKALADAEQKRDFAAEEITRLNSELESLESDWSTLKGELVILGNDIAELKAARDNATSERSMEKAL